MLLCFVLFADSSPQERTVPCSREDPFGVRCPSIDWADNRCVVYCQLWQASSVTLWQLLFIFRFSVRTLIFDLRLDPSPQHCSLHDSSTLVLRSPLLAPPGRPLQRRPHFDAPPHSLPADEFNTRPRSARDRWPPTASLRLTATTPSRSHGTSPPPVRP